MNVVPGPEGRIPNAALVNFGQRADLVRDMLEGTAERKVAEAREHWEKVASNFFQFKDSHFQTVVSQMRQQNGLEGMEPKLLTRGSHDAESKRGNAKAGV